MRSPFLLTRLLRWALLVAPAGPALAQAPVLTGLVPLANARAAAYNGSVAASFSQPLVAASAGALKVFSAQRGGQLATAANTTVSGATVRVVPGRAFRPGEVVQTTITTAVRGSNGVALAAPHVSQFTAAVLGSGGVLGGGTELVVGMAGGPLACADIDGDGDLDLLIVGANTQVVRTQINDGRGNFQAGPSVTVGNAPQNIAVGDVDDDGDLDFVTALNSNTSVNGRVAVLLNNGQGQFSSGPTVAVGNGSFDVKLADVDGDGDLDLLTANYYGTAGSWLSVRLNNGSGAFGGGSDFGGSPAGQIAVADVNGDGALDVLASGHSAGVLSLCLNNGQGGFRGGSVIATGSQPGALALADVDGDYFLDLLVVCAGSREVRRHLNNGAGGFAAGVSIPVGGSPIGLAVADLNGDGNLDLLVSDFAGASVRYFFNTGLGTFGPPQAVAVGRNPWPLTTADLDNDGDLDLLVANYDNGQGTTASLRFNSGTGAALAARPGAVVRLGLAPNPAHGAACATGLLPGATVRVLDALGRPVAQATADAAGTALLTLPAGLAAGVYVVHSGPQTQRLAVE